MLRLSGRQKYLILFPLLIININIVISIQYYTLLLNDQDLLGHIL